MVAFAVYSACVDPDRVLRALRPLAGRSALTATLVSRLVPVAAADAARLRDAGRLRGPGAAPVGRAALARRLLAGSLDRAVDVAATSSCAATASTRAAGRAARPRRRALRPALLPRGRGLLVVAVGRGAILGAGGFDAYPIEVDPDPSPLGLVAPAGSPPSPQAGPPRRPARRRSSWPPEPARRSPSRASPTPTRDAAAGLGASR